MMDLSNIEILLFDLGGVIIDIDFDRAVQYWSKASGKSFEWINHRFTVDANYQRHERGEISSEEFFNHLQLTLDIDLSIEEMMTGWNALIIDEVTGIKQLLDKIADKKALCAFSNINPAHLENCWSRFGDVLSRFEKIFASSQIGQRKPEPEAYQIVISELNIPAQNILFFDDLVDNVEAARNSGMHTVQVSDIADIEYALRALVA